MELISRLFGAASAGINAAEARAQLSQKPGPFLLDVRQPEEFRSGHIPGAKLIPLGELRQRIHELPKDREIICVCRSGNRSSSATRQLSEAGFKVKNMNGGMIAWSRANFPVKKAQ
jgi:rhodanese-related sulfurtransferase